MVDRIGAMGRGEPDPGERRPGLRDLWGLNTRIAQEMADEIDKTIAEEAHKFVRKRRRRRRT